jgi:hypothetical protein
MQTDILGTSIGVAGIIIGVIASYYFYRKSLRNKEPSWAIRSNNIVQGFSNKIESLKVVYNDVLVENLTISKVLFWNEGAETIHRRDIETINKLRIDCLEKVKILDAKILVCNNRSSEFDVVVSEEENCAYILFDYLDRKQGAVIQVIHTGTISEDLRVVGDIKGVSTLRSVLEKPKWVNFANKVSIPKNKIRRSMGGYAMGMGIIYVILGIIKLLIPSFLQSSPPTVYLFPGGETLMAVIIFFGGGSLLFFMGFSMFKRIAPKGLELFQEEK